MCTVENNNYESLFGIHDYFLQESSDPLEKYDRRIWVEVDYCQGQKRAHEAYAENVFYTAESLPTKLTDFFSKKYVLADKIRYNCFDETLTIQALQVDKRGFVVRATNTGPYTFYIGDHVYLGPPMYGQDLFNTVKLNGKLYFTPTLFTEQGLKKTLCCDSYRFLSGSYGQRVKDANDSGAYMNWILGGSEGENWDRSLEGFAPNKAKIVENLTELESIFKRKRDYLQGKNQPLDIQHIQDHLLQKEFEDVSNRLSLLLAQAAAAEQQQEPVFWQMPSMLTLFGNFPRPIGKVVYTYGGGERNPYYSSSTFSQATSILPGEEMGISLVWN